MGALQKRASSISAGVTGILLKKNLLIGSRAEKIACSFLEKKGLSLITKNYHAKGGEIDLIMYDAGTIVFVEVRYRRHYAYGSSIETIDSTKQHKVIKTAKHYLVNEGLYEKIDCRFDAIGINNLKKITWIRDAF